MMPLITVSAKKQDTADTRRGAVPHGAEPCERRAVALSSLYGRDGKGGIWLQPERQAACQDTSSHQRVQLPRCCGSPLMLGFRRNSQKAATLMLDSRPTKDLSA